MNKQEEMEGAVTTILVGVTTHTISGSEATRQIFEYLHSQGVVIKVERELPDSLMAGQVAFDSDHMLERLNEAGFSAVATLIPDACAVKHEETPEPPDNKCPVCNGYGTIEHNFGLILEKCDECNGTGEIADDDSVSGDREPDTDTGSKNASKPSKPKKSKKRKKTRKAAG